MASTTARNTRTPNFILSPHQQNLLFAALNSNKVPTLDTSLQHNSADGLPATFNGSPLQQVPGSGTLNPLEESPYIDYDYDFDNDGSFGDYDFGSEQGQMIGNLPGSSSDGDAGTHDKRGHSEDDDDENDGGGKRREGDDKSSKKPGRKPLTSEPTSKRKAQNRAAQRAFRERKEKHLKDLETKVQDLEKASESANHENSILRAQVEKMSVELKEYRKRLANGGNVPNRAATINGSLPPYLGGRGVNSNTVNNPNDVNFQFEFPKFGKLPGPPVRHTSSVSGASPTSQSPRGTITNSSTTSPLDQMLHHASNFSSPNNNLAPFNPVDGNDMAQFSALFSPNTLDTIAKETTYDYISQVGSIASRSSIDSGNGPNSAGQSTSHSSPSVSSLSNNGLSSSCDTSPEPFTQSPPAMKHSENVLGTIGEENHESSTTQGEASFREKLAMACGNPSNPIPRTMSKSSVSSGSLQTPGFDINGIDWFAQQNGNQFDPQLFGDYREPQENILSGGLYDDTFFNEAYALPELHSPFTLEASPAPKKDLVQEIDNKLTAEDEVVPGEPQMLNCTNMWEKIQACPRVQNGEIDMDSLCSQLQQKAKCSGEGPVIQEKDFKEVISSMFPTGASPF